MINYLLKGHEVVAEPDLLAWAKSMAYANSRIALTKMADNVEVSTVFLGVDQRGTFIESDLPLVFETVVFGGAQDRDRTFYSTLDEAIQGHKKIVASLR